MLVKYALPLTLIAAMLNACATTSPNNTGSESSGKAAIEKPLPQAELVASLPKKVESFDLAGAKPFNDDGDGVTVHYANAQKRRRADVFVYPVAEGNRKMKHPELVFGSTQATMRAIAHAVQQGIYQNLNVLDAATKANGVRTIARVQATYLRNNLASYTLVYQTEHDGTMVKIRVTMPDNESNRKSREWDRFADSVFKAIGSELDSKNAALPAKPAADKTAGKSDSKTTAVSVDTAPRVPPHEL